MSYDEAEWARVYPAYKALMRRVTRRRRLYLLTHPWQLLRRDR